MVEQLNERLSVVDPKVQQAIAEELVSQHPGRRYYGGCEHVDVVEQLALDRVKDLTVVTKTTHKTLGTPCGSAILAKEQYPKKINSAVFADQQGGPLEYVIAAKAVAFKLAGSPEFKERQECVLQGSRLLAERLLRGDVAAAGISVVNGGTDVHLVLVDLRNSELDGQQAEDLPPAVSVRPQRSSTLSQPPRSPLRRCAPAPSLRSVTTSPWDSLQESSPWPTSSPLHPPLNAGTENAAFENPMIGAAQ